MATGNPATSPDVIPDYLKAATPNPPSKRGPWYSNTAPTYAGIFLWFVFWDPISSNGLSVGGLAMSLLGIVIGALICHFLYYLIPALLGMKTGLPLYVVGSSTFGATGGLLMPGFLMGLLQFGWLAVNAFYSSKRLADSDTSVLFIILCIAWVALAAFLGLKGIQYVAKVATFLPLIPLGVLIFALVQFGGSAGSYTPPAAAGGNALLAMLAMAAAIVGFFATAGAAGVDFGMNSQDKKDVQTGGLVGIVLAILFTAGASVLIVAGGQAQNVVLPTGANPNEATSYLRATQSATVYYLISLGLTLASFPGACFSSFIAANSFKTVMPRVNPFISVGIGALVSMILAITRVAGDLPSVFILIGASFGPICGAMCADYLLAGGRWAGPRAGFNIAGWGAWLIGFIVGILPTLHEKVSTAFPNLPASAIAAYVVGFVVYVVLAKAGMEGRVLNYPQALEQKKEGMA